MMLFVRSTSADEARMVLAFFKGHPDRDHCIAQIGDDGPMVKYEREDIPRLTQIASLKK